MADSTDEPLTVRRPSAASLAILASSLDPCESSAMKLLVGLLLVAGVGSIIWSMLSPPVLFRILLRDGHVRTTGRVPPRASAEIEEFFQANFSHQQQLCVDVLPPTARFRSRVHITGTLSEGEKQLIRNFLLTHL
jgi:hypothetical protein